MSHVLENQAARGYRLTVCNPPLNSDKLPLLRQINDRAEAMWEVMEQEQQTGEGWIEPLGEQAFAVFPTNQYVPEEGDAFHYMLTFDLGTEYAKPDNTPNESAVTAARQMDRFLDIPDSVACYNMYYGRRDIKAPSMSWRNWHIHCSTLPEGILEPTAHGVSLLREPGDRIREKYFVQEFEKIRTNDPESVNALRYAHVLTADEEHMYRYNFNGVVARMPHLQPEDLVQTMIDIDTLCKDLHRKIFSTSVSNYDEVAASHWREPYTLRPEQEVQQYIDTLSDPLEREFLTKSHKGLLRGLFPKREKDAIYPGPCYSVSFFKDDEGTVFVIDPHSFRRNGGLESLGVIVERQNNEQITTAKRAQRAHAAVII